MKLILIVAALAAIMSVAEAKSPFKPELVPGSPVESQLQEHGDYTNAKGGKRARARPQPYR